MKHFKNLFRQQSSDELAKQMFQQCERDLLYAQEAAEYWKHNVACLQERHARLKALQKAGE